MVPASPLDREDRTNQITPEKLIASYALLPQPTARCAILDLYEDTDTVVINVPAPIALSGRQAFQVAVVLMGLDPFKDDDRLAAFARFEGDDNDDDPALTPGQFGSLAFLAAAARVRGVA